MVKPRGANDANRAATRAHLLAVAEAVFVERGFDGATTTEIVARANLAQGSLYYHFRDKHGLFVAVHNDFQLRFIGRILERAERSSVPWERFDAIWRGYLEACSEPAVRQILLLDGPRVLGLQQLRAQDRESALGFFAGELGKLAEAGLLPPIDLRPLAVLLFGALDQAAFEIADFPDDTALKARLIDAFADLLERIAARPA